MPARKYPYGGYEKDRQKDTGRMQSNRTVSTNEGSTHERNKTDAESSGYGRSTHPPVFRRRSAGESGTALPYHRREDAQAHAAGETRAQKEGHAPPAERKE